MNKLFSNKNVVKILALVLVGVFIVTMSYKENQFKSKASDESINVLKDEDIDTSDDMDEEDFDEEDFDEENIQNEYTLAMDKYEQFIDSVEEKEIVKMQDNQYVYDEKALCEEYDKYKIGEISNDKDSLNNLFQNIKEVNKNLLNDTMTAMPDHSVMYTTDVQLLTRGGKTYDKTYWWGRRRFKSTKAATKWAHEIEQTAARNAGLGAVSLLLGPIGGIPGVIGGVSSAFCWSFASDINYVNNNSLSGIKADCPWTLFGYKIKKQ